MRGPLAPERPHTVTLHGETREDPYAWLRVDNWQEVMRDPSVLDGAVCEHLEAENRYTEAFMAPHADLQEAVFQEMKGRIKEDDSTVPSPDGAWAYFVRYEVGGQHPICCREPSSGGAAQVLLHGDREAEGLAFWQLAGWEHSPDHRRLAYATDTKGSELYSLRVRDLGSGRDLEDVIERTSGSFEWSNDGEHLFYTVLDDNHRPSKVFRHEIGSDPATDVLVYEEPDPGFFVGVAKTESNKYIVIDSHDHETSEARLVPAAQPTLEARVVRERTPGVEYDVSHHGDRLLILTNADDAEDFKIVEADEEGRHWRDVVAHEPGRLIRSLSVYRDFLVRLEMVDALPRIVVRPFADPGNEYVIDFPEEAYSLGTHGSYEYESSRLRFSYSSMTTPAQVFDYDMDTRERRLRKEQEVPTGHDPDRYVVTREHARATDGELVPITILRLRSTQLDSTGPVLLYGYGAYGLSMPAAFGTARLSLVDRGFVYAIAHIRGGMEKGYRWYTEGKRMKKRNTFSDFAAAAEHLVARGYARPGRIAAQGGSAGGMLMGVVANEYPELFGAILAEVPFVDVLNTMSDETLPLTPPEWPEWGNPAQDEAAYAYIREYSPYDNVERRPRPAILATAGLADPRVTYWEPAKWVARLRERAVDDTPLLLKTNMEAGHGGAAGRFERLRETAMVFTFLLAVFEMTEQQQRS